MKAQAADTLMHQRRLGVAMSAHVSMRTISEEFQSSDWLWRVFHIIRRRYHESNMSLAGEDDDALMWLL